MTGLFDKLNKMFNTAGGNYDQKASVIDPEKLVAAADRMTQLLQHEEKERMQRMARFEEAAEKLKQSADQLMAQIMAQQADPTTAQHDDGMDIAPQMTEDLERMRVIGVQRAMGRGTTQQISAPRTASFRFVR